MEARPGRDGSLQVLVVGAGIVGLSAAAFLRCRGFDPTVVPAGSASQDTRGAVLWRNCLRQLDGLGIERPRSSTTTPMHRWEVTRVDGTAPDSVDLDRSGEAAVVAVDRRHLRSALLDAIPSTGVRVAKTPQAVRGSNAGVEVAFDDGVTEPFDVVVRAAPRGAIDRGRSPTTVTWCDARTQRRQQTIIEVWTERSVLVRTPLQSGDAFQFVTRTTDAEAAGSELAAAVDALDGPVSFPDRPAPETDEEVDRCPRWRSGCVFDVGAPDHAFTSLDPFLPTRSIVNAAAVADGLAECSTPEAAMVAYGRRREVVDTSVARPPRAIRDDLPAARKWYHERVRKIGATTVHD